MQVEEFYDLFGTYNEMYLIAILLTYALAIISLFMVFRKNDYSNRFISFTLAFLWSWIGVVFGILVFSPLPLVMGGIEIPGVWYLFGGVFAIQGIILLFSGVFKDTVSYTWKSDSRHYLGLILILYSLALYPLIGFLHGRVYPEYPIFGIAPCPVTIFTIALLLWSDTRPSLEFWIIPIFWGFMGLAAILVYQVYADIVLVLSGLIGLYYYIRWPT
ncbi:MAG: DUF6064 family protein [Candidatus Thorarchaeota archaeon]